MCYNPELATEVTLQPIRRYGFDAAILFADILLVPQALGADLWFVTGEGPRLSTVTTQADFDRLRPVGDIHETLNPIYQTVRNLAGELPRETTLIGFAGAPWTVATYMIAGQGTKDQGPAHLLRTQDNALFEKLLDLITKATIEYMSAQIDAGAEVMKIFDSWAGSLPGDAFEKYALAPAREITQELKKRHPGIPIIGFPREAGDKYIGFAKATGWIVWRSIIPSRRIGRPNMCRWTVACRATLHRPIWSPAGRRWWMRRGRSSKPFPRARISLT